MHASSLAYRGSCRSFGEDLNVCIIEERRRSLVLLMTRSLRAAVCLMRELSGDGGIDMQLTKELHRAFTNPNLPGTVNLENQISRIAGWEAMRMEGPIMGAIERLDGAVQEHLVLINSCLRLRQIVPWECYLVENYARQIRPLLIKLARQCGVLGDIEDNQESDIESTGSTPAPSPTVSSSSMDSVDSADLESVASSYPNRRMWRLAFIPDDWDGSSALCSSKARRAFSLTS